MKMKLWVLSGTNADEASPRLPGLYLTREAADEAFDELMREAWDDLGDEEEEYPGASEVQYRLRQLNGREQGLWDITAHEIDVPVPNAFRDLLTLAKGLDAFQDDYRMAAVLRACEGVVEDARAPADPWQAAIAALQEKYGGFEGGHPYWTRDEWAAEVCRGETGHWYWDWVAARIKAEGEEGESNG